MEEEPNKGKAQADVLFKSVLKIFLDERDDCEGEQLGLTPNGFTEATVIKDYPIRKRKAILHVRRRRYKAVNAGTIREIKSARDCIKSKEQEVLNYFINRSTNAAAELLNSKMKGFRAQLRGVADIPFCLCRVSMIFG